MKILYTADWHLRCKVPENRLESPSDFYQLQLDKIKEIFNILNNEADIMIIGGDLFDRYKPEYSLLNDIIRILKSSKKPIYVVLGNHDLIGANLKSVRRSGVGALIEAKIVNYLFSTQDNVFSSETHSIRVRGYHYRLEVDPEKDYMFKKKFENTTDIIVTHDLIVPPGEYPFTCIPYDTIKTNADIVLCSHWHRPFKGKVGKTDFYNPGCIVRTDITEVDHRPQIMMVEVTDDGKVGIEARFLKCSKEGKEVFDMERVKERKNHLQEYSQFVENLSDVKLENLKVDQIVQVLGKEGNVKTEIVEEAKKRVLKAEKELG